jgi:nucleotide-binding universal stress UspA family protein
MDARQPGAPPPLRIMVATDGSDDARRAVDWLARLPLPPTTQVVAVTVATVPPAPLDIPTVRQFTQALRDEALRTVESARATLAARWPAAQARLGEGEPRAELLRAIDEWAPDLVVLGARGLSAVAGALLGSVSLAVARHAACSVLVVKPAARPLRAVLVAADGSPHAAAAFFASLSLERMLDVRVLGVVEPPHFPSSAPAALQPALRAAADDMMKERSAELEKALADVAAPLHGKVRVMVGRAAATIVDEAAGRAADLIVVGARGMGHVTRLLLGSVSERVLRHAACPVLIVKRRTQ